MAWRMRPWRAKVPTNRDSASWIGKGVDGRKQQGIVYAFGPPRTQVLGSLAGRSLVRWLVLLLLAGCALPPEESPREPLPLAASPPSQPAVALPPSPAEQLRLSPLTFGPEPLMQGLERLEQRRKTSRYVHGIEIDLGRGHYGFDGSGMVDYLVPIADSSRLRHDDDTRGKNDGFGYGTILIQTDPQSGSPSGFSFAGARAGRVFGTKIVIGRPLSSR